MKLKGKIWKHKKHWLVEVPALKMMTQGYSRADAQFMIKDAIMEYMKYYFGSEINDSVLKVTEKTEPFIEIRDDSNEVLPKLAHRRKVESFF